MMYFYLKFIELALDKLIKTCYNKFKVNGYIKEENKMVDTKMVAKKLRAITKKEFEGCKFSIRTKYNEVSVTLVSAPFEAFASLEYITELPPIQSHDGTHCQLNHYHIEQDYRGRWASNGAHLTEQCAKMFIRICDVMGEYNYDRSDIQTDYFDVGFYVHLAIGRWDKPFIIK